MSELEQYLKDHKPVVKDDPTFLLEAQRRMEQVAGIKGEVDRQRRHGRRALVIALCAGLVLGVAVSAIAFFYPVNPESMGQGILDSLRLFLQDYREYFLLPTALIAIALALVLLRNKKGSAWGAL
ncbi:MAG: hypothetical protein IKZ72_04880 [Bacteroidales bacterium]|nr:hypothetical protein [Bacteroidales bacterium]